MKRIRKMAAGLLLSLFVLLLACATASAEGFELDNGVTWTTTAQELLDAEGVQQAEDYDYSVYNGYELYEIESDADTQALSNAYGFLNGQMVFAATYYTQAAADSFSAYEAALRARYGEPTETDAVHATALFDRVEAGALDAEYLTAISGWTLADGTAAYLFVLDGDIYTFYFNEPALLGPENAAQPAESFVFYNDITWVSSLEDMQAAEGAAGVPVTLGAYQAYFYTDRQIGGEAAETAYFFRGDDLAIAAVSYGLNHNTSGLWSAYGTPAPKDAGKLAELLYFLFEDQTDRLTITDITNWSLADGTWIILFRLEDEGIYIFYCNEPLILNAETAFTFYNGADWTTTPEQMLALEGGEDPEDYGAILDGTCLMKHFDGRTLGTESISVDYVYRGDVPVVMAITYDSDRIEAYTSRFTELCAAYGSPAETDSRHVQQLYAAFESAFEPDDFQIVSGWALGDGTMAYLLVIDDTLYNIYFNVPAIADILE